MPYFILLEVDSEEQAKTLAADLVKYPEGKLLTPVQENEVNVKLVGSFRKPTLFCDPTDGHRSGHKTYTGWSRGQKWGWWVCAICGKPSKQWGTGDNWEHTLGTNLLPPSLTGLKRLLGWTSPMQWNFLLESSGDGS